MALITENANNSLREKWSRWEYHSKPFKAIKWPNHAICWTQHTKACKTKITEWDQAKEKRQPAAISPMQSLLAILLRPCRNGTKALSTIATFRTTAPGTTCDCLGSCLAASLSLRKTGQWGRKYATLEVQSGHFQLRSFPSELKLTYCSSPAR